MTNTLIDNTDHLKMVDRIRKCIADERCTVIKIATGYWDIPGTALLLSELKDFLKKEGTKLQLMIGSDPIARVEQLKRPIANARFPQDYIKRNLHELEVKEKYVDTVALLQKYCKRDEVESKLQIRLYKTDDEGNAQFFHAKCYIFYGEGFAVGIIGSSNFTRKGLEGNAELNYLETNSAVIKEIPDCVSPNKGHICWFDENWEISTPWNQIFLEEVLKNAPVAIQAEKKKKEQTLELTPYEVYIRYLQTQFGEIADVSSDGVLKSYLPSRYSVLQYQLDAVKHCFTIMRRHHGFVLGDVVGLGKTVVGVLLVKKFLSEAGDLERQPKVLIITPPAIKKEWKRTIADFDRENDNKIASRITFVTTGSIVGLMGDMEILEEEPEEFDEQLTYNDYGLILVDESHNFRNSDTQMYRALDDLIDKITLRAGQPYVGLLSATPFNNDPKDLRNQIYLFQREPNNSDIEGVPGGHLDSFFNGVIRTYKEHKMTSTVEPSKTILMEMSRSIRECVLNYIVVRRTRTDVKKQYPKDSSILHFPTVVGPCKLVYEMDSDMAKLFAYTVSMIASNLPDEDPTEHLGFYRYCAIKYFRNKENERLYEKRNLTVSSISLRLQKIMKTLLVKRLESSKTAFKQSLINLRQYTRNMLAMIEHDCVFICPDIDVNAEFRKADNKFADAAKAIRHKIERKGGNNFEFKASDFKSEYKEKLEEDLRIIDKLYEGWSQNEDDPKLDCFLEALTPELFNPNKNTSQKIVIFTEAIDTQRLIAKKAQKKGYRVLSVSAENRDEMHEVIVANFDANASNQRDDYDMIVTTEVLAEGVNLHRANVILNYDTPWNATRLMQRVGRVNRIGSKAPMVYVYNFFPSAKGNEQIHLLENAYAKLQAFHILFGEDNKVFSEMEEIPDVEFTHDFDGEESEMGKFIKELRNFREIHPERYAYLSSIPFEMLGGTLKSEEFEGSTIMVKAPKKGLVPVVVDEALKANVISDLEAMKRLKCTEDASYVSALTSESPICQAAIRCYNTQVSRSLSARDAAKRQKQALDVLDKIRHIEGVSPESNSIINAANMAIRHKNSAIIKALIEFDKNYRKEQQTLFGIDFDINSWLQGAFAHIADLNVRQYGEPIIAFYRVNQ